jgi:ribose 5-phosphate isomerase RpiB
MRIPAKAMAVVADECAFGLKKKPVGHSKSKDGALQDYGVFGKSPSKYADMAETVAQAVVEGAHG